METDFISRRQPLMNNFLFQLEQTLANLPNNPKPTCKGFYLADYDPTTKELLVEKVGSVPPEKDLKYLHYATKKVTQTLLFGATRSKEFENNDLEQYPGGFALKTSLGTYGTGVSGHESMIDEAISVLWQVAKKIIRESDASNAFVASKRFYSKITSEAEEIQRTLAPDNKWIAIIAKMMETY